MHPAIPAQPRTVWQAMTRPGYLLSAWPWRSIGYLVTGALTGAAALVAIVILAAVGGILAVVLVGLPLLFCITLAGLPVARVERFRLRLGRVSKVDLGREMILLRGAW
ncbi:sensor domain-containing protein, partial [Streptomyces xiangluensis]